MTEKAGITALSESPMFGASRAGKNTMATPPEQVSERIFSRRTRLTPDTALLSESSGWNRVISAPLTLVRGVYFFIRN